MREQPPSSLAGGVTLLVGVAMFAAIPWTAVAVGVLVASAAVASATIGSIIVAESTNKNASTNYPTKGKRPNRRKRTP